MTINRLIIDLDGLWVKNLPLTCYSFLILLVQSFVSRMSIDSYYHRRARSDRKKRTKTTTMMMTPLTKTVQAIMDMRQSLH